jgi:threonine/homoserine/homoserine lactone efflux protein
MPRERLFAFGLFAVAAATTPGPNNVLGMAAGARGGILGGLPCLGASRPAWGSCWAGGPQSSACFAAVATPCCGVWLVFGGWLRRWLGDRRHARAFGVGMGILLALSVLLVAR